MGVLRRRAAALAVGVTLVGTAAGARMATATTSSDLHSSGGSDAATERIRIETASASVSDTSAPPSVGGLRGYFPDGGRQNELAGKLVVVDGLDGSARGDLASKLIAGLGEGGAGSDEEFAATLAEALGSRGRDGELAEKLLAGLGEGGERQQLLAAKLLAGLGTTQQADGGRGGGGGKYAEVATETDRAHDLSAGGVGPSRDDGKLSAAIAEALDCIRRQAAEGGGGGGGGVLEHILTTLMSFEETEEELPSRGDSVGEVSVLAREGPPRERQAPSGLLLRPAGAGAGGSAQAPPRSGAWLAGNDAALESGDPFVAAPGGFVDDLPTTTAAQQRGHEGAAAAAATAAADASEDAVVESLPSQLLGAFRRTFGVFLRPFREDAARGRGPADGAPAALVGEGRRGSGEGAGLAGRVSTQRRRLQTSSGGNSGNTQLEIVTMNGLTASDWNGAYYTLEVGTTVPGQTLRTGRIIARGTIDEGEEPSQRTENLERGCYVIYTSAGSRPYDVLWELQVAGELYHDVSGGGQDFHVFGVGGALCGMSECYRQCYEAHEDNDETNDCASFGDLLAPPDEPVGANCTCTEDEELELRLACLSRGCDSRSQCYLLDDSEIVTAPTLTIVSYVEIVTSTINVASMEAAMAQWLDLDPQYVDLVRVNGLETSTSKLTSRRRLGDDAGQEEANGEEEGGEGVFGAPNGGGDEGEWDGMEEEREEWQSQASNRGLQTAIFKRLEFRIIGNSANDFPFIATLAEGVRGLSTVLKAQDEESGVQQVVPYTASYTDIEETRVALSAVPGVDIGGSGGGTGVDEEGEVIVQATDAPAEFGDFTTSTQFLIGAGLVVVVSFFLSIVACIVCRMKRRDRKEFERKNAPEDGRRKPVAYVDPWGSVARTFQKDSQYPTKGSVSSNSSRLGGHSNGSAHGRSGSRTANSSASA